MRESLANDRRFGGITNTALLTGAVAFLMATTIYGHYKIAALQSQLVATQELLETQIAGVSAQTGETAPLVDPDAIVEDLRTELEQARVEAEQLAGQAREDALRQAGQIAAQFEQLQQQQAEEMASRVSAVSGDVNALSESTEARVGEVNAGLADVRNMAGKTQQELTLTVEELRTAQGDLGTHSGQIATNAEQLEALRRLGERDNVEFQLVKSDTTARIGDLYVRLKKTNERRNQYTIEVIVDDKLIEKKDRTVNEPVQFIVPPAVQPYEFVVNEVQKDLIRGYLSVPRVKVVASR